MQPIQTAVNVWGPAILVCLTVLVGVFYQNKRIDDLRNDFNARLTDLNSRLTDLRTHLDTRIDGLRELVSSHPPTK